MSKRIFFLLVISAILFNFGLANPSVSDPPRLKVIEKAHGKVVVRHDSTLIRGNALTIWKAQTLHYPDQIKHIYDSSYYKMIADSGINAIRVGSFDAWMNNRPKAAEENWPVADFTNPSDLEIYFKEMDTIVYFASKYDMHVIVLFGGVGDYRHEYRDADAESMGYCREFWTAVAPRYKDRTHVNYELMNEPCGYLPGYYLDADLDSIAFIYSLVRDLAPETHIFMFTFPNIGFSASNADMYDKVEKFESRHPGLVDWQKSSVAFHPYEHTDPTSATILKTMDKWPVISTENGYPKDEDLPWPVAGGDPVYTISMDNELFITQTLERLGIGWIQHNASGFERFRANWPLILNDARKKGYIWFSDEPLYQLVINSDNGITIPHGGRFPSGATPVIQAYPDRGYKFSNWTGDVASILNWDGCIYSVDNPLTLKVKNEEIELIANFAPLEVFNITTEAENGWIRLSPPGGEYFEGTEVHVWAIPDEGFEFVEWGEGTLLADTSRQYIILESDLHISAIFEPSVGISTETRLANLLIYPNPVKDHISLTGKKRYDRVQVINILGNVVLDQKLKGNALKLINLENGVYLVLLFKDGDIDGPIRITVNN